MASIQTIAHTCTRSLCTVQGNCLGNTQPSSATGLPFFSRWRHLYTYLDAIAQLARKTATLYAQQPLKYWQLSCESFFLEHTLKLSTVRPTL